SETVRGLSCLSYCGCLLCRHPSPTRRSSDLLLLDDAVHRIFAGSESGDAHARQSRPPRGQRTVAGTLRGVRRRHQALPAITVGGGAGKACQLIGSCSWNARIRSSASRRVTPPWKSRTRRWSSVESWVILGRQGPRVLTSTGTVIAAS